MRLIFTSTSSRSVYILSNAFKLLPNSLLSVSRSDLLSYNERPSERKAMMLSKLVVGREDHINANDAAPPRLSTSSFDSVSAIL